MSSLGRSAAGLGPSRKRTKHHVYDAYLQHLLKRPDISYLENGFTERLKRHFDLLPTRYALDINIETLDVLNHMQLLEEARKDASAVFFHVRVVEVLVHSRHGSDHFDTTAESQVRNSSSGHLRSLFSPCGRLTPKPTGSPPRWSADRHTAGLHSCA